MSRVCFVFLAAALLCAAAGAEPTQIQYGASSVAVSRDRPMPVDCINDGYLTGMATQTFEVGATAVRLPVLPAGTHTIGMIASGGACFFGGSDVSNVADDSIASGSCRYWSGIGTTTPNLWFRNTASVTVRIRPIGTVR